MKSKKQDRLTRILEGSAFAAERAEERATKALEAADVVQRGLIDTVEQADAKALAMIGEAEMLREGMRLHLEDQIDRPLALALAAIDAAVREAWALVQQRAEAARSGLQTDADRLRAPVVAALAELERSQSGVVEARQGLREAVGASTAAVEAVKVATHDCRAALGTLRQARSLLTSADTHPQVGAGEAV